MANTLTYQGVDVQKAFDTMAQSGIRSEIAAQIIGIWIGQAAINTRHFGYSHSLTDAEAACSPAPFARGFSHQDWVDGESVVQAGETPTEKGFNTRFHQIEHDLDALGALVAQCFVCGNSVRATVAQSLREISDELNRINADLTELRKALPTNKVPTGPLGDKLTLVGKTRYFDRDVMVFQDNMGRYINLPDIAPVTLPAGAITRAPKAAEVLGRDADIAQALKDKLTKREIVDKFGDRMSSDGTPLRDLLSALPDTETFDRPDAVIDALADRDAMVMKGLGQDVALRTNLGVADGAAVATASTDKIEGVSTPLAGALAAAGIKTASDMASLSADKLVQIGGGAGLNLSLGAASSLIAQGKLLTRI